jgi:hypothetical protein
MPYGFFATLSINNKPSVANDIAPEEEMVEAKLISKEGKV